MPPARLSLAVYIDVMRREMTVTALNGAIVVRSGPRVRRFEQNQPITVALSDAR